MRKSAKLIAEVAFAVAKAAGNSASYFGLKQPLEPKKLKWRIMHLRWSCKVRNRGCIDNIYGK